MTESKYLAENALQLIVEEHNSKSIQLKLDKIKEVYPFNYIELPAEKGKYRILIISATDRQFARAYFEIGRII